MARQKNIKLLTDHIKNHVHNDWDMIILITGTEGSGKSVLSQTIGFEIDDNFDQIKNISYIPDSDEIIKKFNSLKQYSYFSIDEGAEIFYKMDFMKAYQTTLVKMYKRERKQNKITGICIPKITDLTRAMRDDRVKLWIHCVSRGRGVVMVKNPSPFCKDPWGIETSDKSFEKQFARKNYAEIDNESLIFFLRKSKMFLMELTWDDLSDERKEIYNHQVKIERDAYYKRVEEETGQVDANNKWRNAWQGLAIHLRANGMTKKKIGELSGKSISYDSVKKYVV